MGGRGTLIPPVAGISESFSVRLHGHPDVRRVPMTPLASGMSGTFMRYRCLGSIRSLDCEMRYCSAEGAGQLYRDGALGCVSSFVSRSRNRILTRLR